VTRFVVLRPRAEDDIRTIAAWYESRQAGLGEEFLVQLGEALRHIAEFPLASTVVYRSIRRARVAKFPYLAFCVVEQSRVVVLAVLHTSRNPANWPRR
jgi:plasmid stabilization system protein ParE